MDKIWKKSKSLSDKLTEDFTVGNDHIWDLELVKYDVIASIAHAKMLKSIGLLSNDELNAILNCLDDFQLESQQESFTINKENEDIHTTIEIFLTKRLGDIGKKIHAGRSRNDQVLVAMQLYIKAKIVHFASKIESLAINLLEISEINKGNIIPGYTHMQVAMPSSIGLWLSSYAELLVDDLYYLETAYKIADQNPLGSAAGYGSSFPVDRTLTQQILHFSQLKVNVIAAQSGRGRVEKAFGTAMGTIASTLSKLAMDTCLYTNQNHGFISFPQQYSTGSSIMPHKNNPDIFELVRGRCNRIQTIPQEITLLLNNLPSGYHRELQELKDIIFPSIKSLDSCLDILLTVLPHLTANANTEKDEKYKYMFSVEKVNKLVLEGKSFREAYQIIGDEIINDNFNVDNNLKHTHIGSIGNLRLDLIKEKIINAMLSFSNQNTQE